MASDFEQAYVDCLRLLKAYQAPTVKYENEQLLVEDAPYGVCIAVAGSNDFYDWYQNATAFRFFNFSSYWSFHTTIPGTKYKATTGYVEAAKNVCQSVARYLSKTVDIYLSGHSKGGAVAAIAGEILYSRGYKVRNIRTFACPRFSVQNIDTKVMNSCQQYIAEGDIVPDHPCSNVFRKWRHQGEVYRIGSAVDDHLGKIRDTIDCHLIKNYIKILKELA